MYNFKQIRAKYHFISEVIKPSGESSTYEKVEHIDAVPNLVEGLNFTLQGAADERVDNNPLKEFDLLMAGMGQSIYPVELNVLKTGEIKRLKNFDSIKERWEDKRQDLLSLYDNAYWAERYMNMAAKNLVSEASFMQSIKRSSFIQLFFMKETAQKQTFVLSDFPLAGIVLNLSFDLVTALGSEYRYKSQIGNSGEGILGGNGEIKSRYSDNGLLTEVDLKYNIEVRNEGYYTKNISIKLIENK